MGRSRRSDIYIYVIRYIYTQGQTSRHQTLSVLAQLVVLIQVPTRGILDRPLAGLFWFKSWFAGDIHEMTPRASGLADTRWQHSSLSALALQLQGESEAGRYCGCCCCRCRATRERTPKSPIPARGRPVPPRFGRDSENSRDFQIQVSPCSRSHSI